LAVQNKTILIFSYRLGLSDGVGGRRWMIFGKYLLEKGWDVHFISCQKEVPEEIRQYEKRIHYLPSNYPRILNSVPRNLAGRLLYKLAIVRLRLLVRGTIYDPGKRMKKKFIALADALLQNKKSAVMIVSGAPFSFLHHALQLKRKNSDLKLVADYRDGWSTGVGYGIPQLDKDNLNFERDLELEVLEKADAVTVASRDLAKDLLAMVSRQIEIIYNPVSDAYPLAPAGATPDLNKIVIVLAGSINQGTDGYWINFFENISKFRKNDLGDPVVYIIGNQNTKPEEYVTQKKIQGIHFIPRLTQPELNKFMQRADFYLMFKRDGFEDSFPTKFFEYVKGRKPILCYTRPGEVSAEIEGNSLGVVFSQNTEFDVFLDSIKQFSASGSKYNSEYEPVEFATKTNGKKIEVLLEKL
jgi:hypothetical protein